MSSPHLEKLANNPVFILGAPRSGTSWLNWMLTTHPAIVGGPETNFFLLGFGDAVRKYQAGAVRNWPHSGLHHYLDQPAFLNAIRQTWQTVFAEVITANPNAELLIEKTPKHGAYIDVIRQVFPTARFIHCHRDSLGCVASHLAAGRTWAGERAPKSALHAAKLWRRRVAEIEKSLNDLERLSYQRISYETLKEDPAPVLGKTLNWLDIPYTSEQLQTMVETNTRKNLEKKLAEKEFDSFLSQPDAKATRRLNWAQRMTVQYVTRNWREKMRQFESITPESPSK
jgi:LPS sulfotransferase NodH